MQRSNSRGQTQRLISTHSAIYNTVNIQHHLVSRKIMRIFGNRAFAEYNIAFITVAWDYFIRPSLGRTDLS